jgi:hypothetical protein
MGHQGVVCEALTLIQARPEATNASLSRALGVSRERVRQIREDAGLPSSRRPPAPCRVCGAKSQSRARQLCPKHLYREKHGIPMDAPPKRRQPCSDCGKAPAKVRGRCAKCAYHADPAWRAAARRSQAEYNRRKKPAESRP